MEEIFGLLSSLRGDKLGVEIAIDRSLERLKVCKYDGSCHKLPVPLAKTQ